MDSTLIAATLLLAVSIISSAAVKGGMKNPVRENVVVDNPYWMPMVWLAMPFLTISIALGVVGTMCRAAFELATGTGDDHRAADHDRLARLAAERGDTGSSSAVAHLA